MTVFLNILNRWESAELNQEEAAELLGVSERTFRRWTRRYEEEGEAGLVDRRLGRASGKRVPVEGLLSGASNPSKRAAPTGQIVRYLNRTYRLLPTDNSSKIS